MTQALKQSEIIFITHWSDYHQQWSEPKPITDELRNLSLPFGYFTAINQDMANIFIKRLPSLLSDKNFPGNFSLGGSDRLELVSKKLRIQSLSNLYTYSNYIKSFLRKDITHLFNNFNSISDMIDYLIAVERKQLPPRPDNCKSCQQPISHTQEFFYCKVCQKIVCQDCYRPYTQHCIRCEQ